MSVAYRCRLAKLGRARFLSHLDLMRAIARAFRRAGIDLAHSGGYHPHPLLSFGPALAVGVESLAEYCEVVVAGDDRSAKTLLTVLNAVLPEGIQLLSAAPPQPAAGTLAQINAASYQVWLAPAPDLRAAFAALANRASLPVRRRERALDLRPLLLELELGHLDRGEIGLLGVTGSGGNLRPEELLSLIPGAKVRRVLRTGLYRRNGERLSEPIFGQTVNWKESPSYLE